MKAIAIYTKLNIETETTALTYNNLGFRVIRKMKKEIIIKKRLPFIRN